MSTADELIKLDALRKSGVLTQGEFDAEMNAVPRPSDSGGLTGSSTAVDTLLETSMPALSKGAGRVPVSVFSALLVAGAASLLVWGRSRVSVPSTASGTSLW